MSNHESRHDEPTTVLGWIGDFAGWAISAWLVLGALGIILSLLGWVE